MLIFAGQQPIHWTDHVKMKMHQYRLSESRVKRVMRFPRRLETGVAPDTVAGMQPAGSTKHPYEIWVMWSQKKLKAQKLKFKTQNSKLENFKKFGQKPEIVIISAWRYPGVSPVQEPPPIPDDVWEIIRKIKK